MVIIELIDFIPPRHLDEFQIEPSSSSSSDNIKHLLNLLKSTIRNNRYKKYSLQFETVGTLESIGSHYNYDIVISERYNILIATQSSSIVIYNRFPSNQSAVPDKKFKVDFGSQLNCLTLNTEMNEEFIYVTSSENIVLKINLDHLLKTREKSLIWQSEKFDNLWGIETLNDRVYAMDYSKGIIVLDCESGKKLEDTKLPPISTGYQVVFISPEEMIISHNCCVEIFQLKEDEWQSVTKTSFPIAMSYSLFYERESQLIYLSDSSGPIGEKLKVMKREDLSLVKSFGSFNMNFGICIDRLSGLLYVCDTCDFVVKVYR